MSRMSKRINYLLLIVVIVSSAFFLSACAHTKDISAVDTTFDISVIGYGSVTQAGNFEKEMLLSNRAAVVDAYRNLSERVAGLVVESYTRQGEFEVNKDVVMSQTKSYLLGSQVVDVTYNDNISTAIVSLPLPIDRFGWYRGERSRVSSSLNRPYNYVD